MELETEALLSRAADGVLPHDQAEALAMLSELMSSNEQVPLWTCLISAMFPSACYFKYALFHTPFYLSFLPFPKFPRLHLLLPIAEVISHWARGWA